jgi:3-oxoacyl-[acyl-carrier-protein] synthase II
MSETAQRVVVTGMGVVCCLGDDVDLVYDRLMKGESGIGFIEKVPVDDLAVRFAGEVREFQPEPWIDRKLARRVDPMSAYLLVSAQKAMAQAGLQSEAALEHLDLSRCGVILGSGMGGMNVFQEGWETLHHKGPNRVSPFCIPFSISNITGALFAIQSGFQGPNYSISTACATANYCFLAAADLIRRGICDVVVAGGGEAPVDRLGMAGFAACRALSQRNDEPKRASRPWDRQRDGFVMAEGAGALVIESLEHARARGAPILAEIVGGATNCDAHHFTEPLPDGSGVARCMKMALAQAGLRPDQLDYINAHATSTKLGDEAEIRAIRDVFGSHAPHLRINGTKSLVGHCLGGAGGIEAVVTVQALRTGNLHPTLNLEDPEDWAQDLDLCQTAHWGLPIRAALTNSFGFGGHNSSMILARAPEAP